MSNPDYSINKSLMQRAFGSAARSYDDVAVLQREVGERMCERLQILKQVPACILDLGAGTGKQTLALHRMYKKAHVVSMDIALPMVMQARRHKPWFSPLSFVCADAERLPLADASLDMVYSNLTLQWVDDLDVIFAELRRVLKPDGVLMFSTFGPDTLKELRSSWASVDDAVHVNAFIDMHDIGDALLRAGFAEPVMDVEHFTLTYTSTHTLMQDLKRLGAHNVTQGRRRTLTAPGRMRAMQQAYEAYRDAGVLPASYEVVYGHAWRLADRRSEVTLSLPGQDSH